MTDASIAKNMNASTKQEQLRGRITLTISLIASLLFGLIAVLIYAQPNGENFWGILLTVVISLTGLVSAWLAWRNRATLGSMILLTTILLIALGSPIIARGQGVALGILTTIIGLGISATTLPAAYSNRGNWFSVLAGVLVILLDQYLPDFGFPSNPVFTNIAAVILSIVFIVIIGRQFNSFPLRTKMVISFATITIIPLFILGIYNNYASTSTLNQESQNRLTDLSNAGAEQINNFIIQKLNEINTESKQISLSDYVNTIAALRDGSIFERKAQITLLSFQRKDPVFIHSYAILDAKGNNIGINILDTSAEHLGRNESQQIYFTEVIRTGAPYSSNVVFNEDGEQSIYFSAPIKNSSGLIIGVLRAEYRAYILQRLIRAVASDDPGIFMSVIEESSYLRLADTGNRDLLYKSYKKFSDLEIAALQAENKMPSGTSSEVLAGVDETMIKGIEQIERIPFFDAYSDALGSNTIVTGTHLQFEPWIVLAHQSYSSNLATIRNQTRNTILISLAMASLAILLALGGVQILTLPLITLSKVAEKITAGDRKAIARVTSDDEIGALATSFNRMTEQLNQTLNSLETRVSERTTELEISTNQLQAIGEISKVITSEKKLENLLPLITSLVSERFGFYHTGIFLIDETKQFSILQASNSEGGKNMLERGFRIKNSDGDIVGKVAQSGTAQIALDIGAEAVYFNNLDLPKTRSEMALPLKTRDQIVGVLDMQSEKASAFTENSASTLSILADQIAIALENARLFAQTQQALSEAQALDRKNTRAGWLTFSREEAALGYHQGPTNGRTLTTPIQTDEIRKAMNEGKMLVLNKDAETNEPSIVVPIKLRGQIIGALNIKAPTQNRRWSIDEVNLVEAISERLSLALENARLIQDSQRQVSKEQTISEVTGKIGASINLKNVLQTAVEELGRAMPGSEVMIKFKSDDTHDGK